MIQVRRDEIHAFSGRISNSGFVSIDFEGDEYLVRGICVRRLRENNQLIINEAYRVTEYDGKDVRVSRVVDTRTLYRLKRTILSRDSLDNPNVGEKSLEGSL